MSEEARDVGFADVLDRPPARMLLKVMEVREEADRRTRRMARTLELLPGLFRDLMALDLEPRIAEYSDSFDVSLAGDARALARVWGALRRAGYSPRTRPEKGQSGYTSFWDHAEPDRVTKFYLSFSSTVCRRVKVGTRMVEQDVYENVCDGGGVDVAAIEGDDGRAEHEVAKL